MKEPRTYKINSLTNRTFPQDGYLLNSDCNQEFQLKRGILEHTIAEEYRPLAEPGIVRIPIAIAKIDLTKSEDIEGAPYWINSYFGGRAPEEILELEWDMRPNYSLPLFTGEFPLREEDVVRELSHRILKSPNQGIILTTKGSKLRTTAKDHITAFLNLHHSMRELSSYLPPDLKNLPITCAKQIADAYTPL